MSYHTANYQNRSEHDGRLILISIDSTNRCGFGRLGHAPEYPLMSRRWRDHEHYQATVDFCANYDQNSFDPGYDSEPLSFFEPMVRRVLDESRRHDL